MSRLEDFMEIQKLHHDGWAWRRRFFREGLIPLDGQPDYDTSYVSHRQAAKDCLLNYRGSGYSTPHVYAGKSVLVRQPLDSILSGFSINRT